MLESILGVRWREPLAAIQARFPGAAVVSQTRKVGVVDRTGILGVRSRLDDLFVLTLDVSNCLRSVSFPAAPQDVPHLLQAFRDALGAERSLEQKSLFGTFNHVHEWSTPTASARVCYSTQQSGATATVVGNASVEVHCGALGASLIDTMAAPARNTDAPRSSP